MSSQRRARKERQARNEIPLAVCIDGTIYPIDKIPQELIDRGHIFPKREVVHEDGGGD